jgi:hypothetical protein
MMTRLEWHMRLALEVQLSYRLGQTSFIVARRRCGELWCRCGWLRCQVPHLQAKELHGVG